MKHLNILKVFLVIAAVMAFTTACETTDSPGETTKEFMEEYAEGNIDSALEMLKGYDDATEEEKEKVKTYMSEGQKELEEKGGVESIEILNEDINEEGNMADVNLKTTYGNGETEEYSQKAEKVDGEWMVVIEK